MLLLLLFLIIAFFFGLSLYLFILLRRCRTNAFLLNEALDKTNTGITIIDAKQPNFPIIYNNQGFCNLTGYSKGDTISDNWRFIKGIETTEQDGVQHIREAITSGAFVQEVFLNYKKDGSTFWNELTINPIYQKGELTHFIGIQNDITLQKNEEIQQQKDLDVARTLQTSLLSPNIYE